MKSVMNRFIPVQTTSREIAAVNTLLQRNGRLSFLFAGSRFRLFFRHTASSIPNPAALKMTLQQMKVYAYIIPELLTTRVEMEDKTIELDRLPEPLRSGVMDVLLEEIWKPVENSTGYPLSVEHVQPSDVPSDAFCLGFELVRESDNHHFSGMFLFPTDSLEMAAEWMKKIPPDCTPKWGALPLPGRVEIGRTQVIRGDISELCPNDIILIRETQYPSRWLGQLCFSPDINWTVRISADRIIVQ